MPKIDMVGKVFSRLTVIRQDGYIRPKKPAYLCSCSCGNTTRVSGEFLRSGKTRSCGCLRQEVAANAVRTMNTTHGKFGTRIYRIWTGIVQRTTNPNSKQYQDYGGRGILLHEAWKTFENFYADVGDPPSDLHTLDRRNTNQGYAPGNCRWATSAEQANNRRSNLLITWQGRTQTAAEWARETGHDRRTLTSRIRNGWDVERAMTTPTAPKGRHQ